MCFGSPDIQQPQRLQQSREPVFNESMRTNQNRRGRRGTILTPQTTGQASDMMPVMSGGKKTLLGS